MFPIIYSDDFLKHNVNNFSPEKPERLQAVAFALETASFWEELDWIEPTSVEQRNILPWLLKVHTNEYIEQVKSICLNGGGKLDLDTFAGSHSYDIALLAVSAWLDGVKRVLATNNPAFVLARPPGHHACKSSGGGYCLFSNAAIAASYALEQTNINRVAILDWDVHHGNGTQSIVESHSQIAYCSLHQSPCYPGTGQASDRGKYNNVLNIPISPGSTFESYQPLFEDLAIPFLRNFQPDLLMVSAGYDANHDDLISAISLQPKDFGIFTQFLLKINRRVLFGLEGGYEPNSLSKSVVATVEACLEIFEKNNYES